MVLIGVTPVRKPSVFLTFFEQCMLVLYSKALLLLLLSMLFDKAVVTTILNVLSMTDCRVLVEILVNISIIIN